MQTPVPVILLNRGEAGEGVETEKVLALRGSTDQLGRSTRGDADFRHCPGLRDRIVASW